MVNAQQVPSRVYFGKETWGTTEAKAAIDSMRSNRRVNPTRVRAYTRLMLLGKWMLSPHPMVFDTTGSFVDGQHRAYAILAASKVQPGFTIEVTVARGCDPSVAKVLDTGLPKGAEAIGSMIRSGMDRARVATATGMMFDPTTNKIGRHKWMPEEIADWYDTHKDAVEFACNHISHNTIPVLSGQLRIVVARAWFVEPPERLSEMGSIMRTTVCNNDEDSAAFVLKNQALNMQARRISANSYGIAASYALCDAAVWMFCRRMPSKLIRAGKSLHYTEPCRPDATEGA